jgi:hypothetical protein
MKSFDVSRYAFSNCVDAAMLAGCRGSPPPIAAPGSLRWDSSRSKRHGELVEP